MSVNVNPPPQVRIPSKFFDDPEIRTFFEQLRTILFQLWNRTGGRDDFINNLEYEDNSINNGYIAELSSKIEEILVEIELLYNRQPTDYGVFVKILGDVMRGTLTFAPGTTSNAPVIFQDGSLLTTQTAGALEYSNEHWYITDGARHVIDTNSGEKTSTTTVVNTITETTVFTYTFAANELHIDQRVIFEMLGAYSNASASDDFTITFYLGGSLISTIGRAGGNVTDAGWEAMLSIAIRTAGSSGTYVHWSRFNDGITNAANADITEHAIDTTAAVLFEVKVQWNAAKAGNTFSCTQADLSFKH